MMPCDASQSTLSLEMEKDPGVHLYSAIQKVSNTFYTARIPTKELSLVMERVDERTYPLWSHYSVVQSGGRAVELASQSLKGR